MGKFLKIMGIVFLVLIVGMAALLLWSHQKGEATQEEFFEAVLSGDPQQVIDRLHPELQSDVDRPVLKAWMDAVKEHLGAFKGLAGSEFSTKSSTQNGVNVVESSGEVEFEKGTAKSELRLVDDKIVGFHVTSDALPEDWFAGVADTAFYVDRATSFLQKLLAADVEGARAMMHENLLSKLEPETFAAGVERLKQRVGDVENIEPIGEAFKREAPQELKLRFRIQGSNETLTGSVRFAFDKLQAHLLGFSVPE